ncbi:hypothetical protein SIAM614_18289 [Roseibium aggregatum IAM 12614]|uniref:Uncharacterized protein n=1 Tax=Roseibium aggregatum (strain ATCC 25650 / DSM 13394 / JCM 20685 / NBRC 16684 / NCIMB 2208 / IAM 12614 / B1) TaxID=384765 RepID=A0NPD8_ROSAI|nr:hypothetical protein SIAM614_18289 [Roseibium aggregatum IAM 12614]
MTSQDKQTKSADANSLLQSVVNIYRLFLQLNVHMLNFGQQKIRN